MATIIYFIRHGEIDNPRKVIYGRTINLHLSQIGKKQIKSLAEKFLKDRVFPGIIYTSPLSRTKESVAILKTKFNQTLVVQREELNETNNAPLTGLSLSLIENDPGREYATPGVEPPAAIIKRMESFLKEVLQKHTEKTVFAVSSGDPIAFLYWRLRNPTAKIPSVKQLKRIYLGKGEALKLVFREPKILSLFKLS